MADSYTLIKGARLITGLGQEAQENTSILIKNRLIRELGPADKVQAPEGAEVVDASGKTVMPGLIDAHLHLWGLQNMAALSWVLDDPLTRGMRAVMDAWKLVDAGFTSVRDCGGRIALSLKVGIESGDLVGPRILASGRAVTQTGGHGDPVHFLPVEWSARSGVGRMADGVDEVRKAAREQLRAGADFLKIMTTGGVMSERDVSTSCQYTRPEIEALVEEARNVGVKTATHAQGTQGILNALEAGIDSVEHGFYLDDRCLELMVKQGTALVPALAIVDAIAVKGPEAGVIPASVEKARIAQEAHLKSFARAYKAGVLCGLGTDYLTDPMTPMGENAIELRLYVEKMGLSPLEAITCATANNAKVLGIQDRTGTLEPGKEADLLVVDGDPDKDITLLCDKKKLIHIIKQGRPVPRLGSLGVRGIE